MIPYGLHSVDNKDIIEVKKVLKSKFLTQGPKVKLFEKQIQNVCKSNFCTTTTSASVALYLACRALGLKKGDLFWTVPNTFVASANAGLLCGAKVDFIDIDPETNNICMDKLKHKLNKAKKKPKLIIPVHFAGLPYDQKELWKLKKKYKFNIIEDASHALGAYNEKVPVGSCKWSDITVFSFHPVKIITTGEGGALTMKSRKFYEKIEILKNNGITKNIKNFKKKIKYRWYYEQVDIGLNYRMNDINAALGLSQIKKLDKFVKARNNIADMYNKSLSNLPISLPKVPKKMKSTFHLYVVKVKKNIRNKLFMELIKNNVLINMHYLPVNFHPFYNNYFKKKLFRNSQEHSDTAISLPIYPGLKQKNQTFVINIIKNFFKKLKKK